MVNDFTLLGMSSQVKDEVVIYMRNDLVAYHLITTIIGIKSDHEMQRDSLYERKSWEVELCSLFVKVI